MHRPIRLHYTVAAVGRQLAALAAALAPTLGRPAFDRILAAFLSVSTSSQRTKVVSVSLCTRQYLRRDKPLRRHASTCTDHHSRRAGLSKWERPAMQPPATRRTPDGQKLHPGIQVPKPDAYKRENEGEIKAPPSVGAQVVGFVQ
ncbi:hypothetical protein IT881_06020 [Erythrobacter sp. A30-3]|nr:hypothetical protein IT881_06020 [Erythrobacter sp. A30-3]